jgi:hypothetical protein
MLKDDSWLFQNFLVYTMIDNHSMGVVYAVHYSLKHSGIKYNQWPLYRCSAFHK